MFTSDLCIPAWSPLFHGHFDGEPILSGVAQLIVVRELLQRHLPGSDIATLDRVRFKASAAPEQTLRFELSEPNDRREVRVSVKREGAVLTQGVIRLAESD